MPETIDYKQFDPTPYNPGDPGTMTKVPPAQEAKPSIAEQRIELQRQKEQQVDQPMIDRLRGMEAQYTALANQRTPVPRDPQFTQPPPAPKLDFTEPIRALQNPGVLIATLGSFFSRAPMTAAMNAGGAAMEAYHKGEAEVFAQKREEWKENLTVALEKNKIAMDKLQNEWRKSDVAVKDRLARMQAIAAGEKMETVIGAIQGGHFEQMDKIFEGLQKAQEKADESLMLLDRQRAMAEYRQGLHEAGRTKLDPAIVNKLPNYPGMTQTDLRDMNVASQRRVIGAWESGEHLENIANYARENPEAYGLLAEATKKMKLDAYNSLWANKPLDPGLVSQVQGDREKLIDDTAREKGYNPSMAAKAKILGKMLTTQSFADAAQAGARGATVFLDRAFREIYDQASSPEAFYGILEKRYQDSDILLKQYNMGFDRRSDKENLRFWNEKAKGYVQGQAGSPAADVPVGTMKFYQGTNWRFKGGNPRDKSNWEPVS